MPLPQLPWTLPLRLGYLTYQILVHLLLPLVLIALRLRARREPLYTAHLGQRFGRCPPVPEGCVWVFAASLGETRAVTPLIREIMARGLPVLLTHSAPAGLQEGQRQFADDIAAGRLISAYAPLDLFWAMRRLLRRARPILTLVVEAEIWPAQIIASNRAGVPVVKVNANLTERSLIRDQEKAWGRLRLFFLKGLARILTKTPEHMDRYTRAGANPARLCLVGELKFDLPPRRDLLNHARALRPILAGSRQVLMIASSIEAEEADLLQVIARLHREMTTPPLIVWAPRSPQRFDAVHDTLVRAGYRTARRSALWDSDFAPLPPEQLPSDLDVLVADSLGEMDFSYGLADIVFVGATLADMGGHNANEPLALERPVVTGPSVYGIPTPAQDAIACGALRVFADADALATGLIAVLSDPAALAAFVAQTAGLTQRHLGAAQRSATALEPLGLPLRAGGSHG